MQLSRRQNNVLARLLHECLDAGIRLVEKSETLDKLGELGCKGSQDEP